MVKMIRINQLRLPVGHNREALRGKIAKKLRFAPETDFEFEIIRRSVDARKKPEIFYNYIVDVAVSASQEKKIINRLNDKSIVFYKPFNYRFPYIMKPLPVTKTAEYQVNLNAAKLQGIKPEPLKLKEEQKAGAMCPRPVIIGAGPAGLFCAYMLAVSGFCPILLERGEAVEERIKTVARFWEEGVLNPESNVQFGEGGAGTFSDGKLNTQVKDKDGLRKAVLSIFVAAGAPENILYEQKPHLGTDMLVRIVSEMRKTIISYGGELRFGQKVTGFLTENFNDKKSNKQSRKITGVIINDNIELIASQVVMAIGNSARDTFGVLFDMNVLMEAKPFAVGFRVSHPQEVINQAQYGVLVHEILGAADYKLIGRINNRAVYSFCMCPGGFIVNASSEDNYLVVNGMSYSRRDSLRANSAIVMAVSPLDFGSVHPLAGIEYQRCLEERAYKVGGGKIPLSFFGDFKKAVYNSSEIESTGIQLNKKRINDGIDPCIKGICCHAPVHEILPQNMNQAFIAAMAEFGRQIPGFDDDSVIIAGIETRTSSPVRILRDESYQSSISGLFPCGEGAGYAGGIMSAAMDGIHVAEALASENNNG